MAITGHDHFEGTHPKPMPEVIAGGSIAEAIGGLGAIILAILGLVGIFPTMMAYIATIALGAAILIEGGTIAARFTRLIARTHTQPAATEIVGGGLAMESLAGLVGIVLGVLALLGVAPQIMLSSAVIVFGAALLIASGATARLNALMVGPPETPYYTPGPGTPYETTPGGTPYPGQQGTPYGGAHRTQGIAYDVISASSGGEVLVGLAAIVLGILTFFGFAPLTLVLVAFLAIGASVLLTGSSFAARILGAFGH